MDARTHTTHTRTNALTATRIHNISMHLHFSVSLNICFKVAHFLLLPPDRYEDPVIASLHFLNAAAEVERLQQQGGGDGVAPNPNEAIYGHPGDGDVSMPGLDRLPSLILERMPTWGSDIGSLPSASAGDDLLLYRSGALPTSPTLSANMSLGAFADQQFAMETDSVRKISMNRSSSFSQAIPDVPQLTRNHSLYLGADNRTLESGDAGGGGAAASGATAEVKGVLSDTTVVAVEIN